jgi:hypothetical protein
MRGRPGTAWRKREGECKYPVSTSLCEADIDRLDAVAKRHRVTRSEWMRRVLLDAIGKDEQENE